MSKIKFILSEDGLEIQFTGYQSYLPCVACNGAKQKWNSSTRMMEDCFSCFGIGNEYENWFGTLVHLPHTGIGNNDSQQKKARVFVPQQYQNLIDNLQDDLEIDFYGELHQNAQMIAIDDTAKAVYEKQAGSKMPDTIIFIVPFTWDSVPPGVTVI